MSVTEAPQLSEGSFFASGDIHNVFRRLRADAPVAWTQEDAGPGFWSVTRYEDARRVLTDSDVFLNGYGTILTPHRTEVKPAEDVMIGLMDPPRHGKLRAQLSPSFVRGVIAGLEPTVRDVVRDALGTQWGGQRFDAVGDLIRRIPVNVIGAMMGIPVERHESLIASVHDSVAGDAFEQQIAQVEILDELASYCRAERQPEGSPVHAIAAAAIDGQALTRDEFLGNCYNVFTAGITTSGNAMAGAVLELARRPEMLDELRSGSIDAEVMTEEVLRWTSPGTVILRTAAREVQLGEILVAPGQQVAVWLVSANRDESVFTAPDEFDPGRRPNRHLAFGVGRHFCLGSAIAKLEIQVFLQEVAKAWDAITVAGDIRYLPSLATHGLAELPVAVSWRPRHEDAQCVINL